MKFIKKIIALAVDDVDTDPGSEPAFLLSFVATSPYEVKRGTAWINAGEYAVIRRDVEAAGDKPLLLNEHVAVNMIENLDIAWNDLSFQVEAAAIREFHETMGEGPSQPGRLLYKVPGLTHFAPYGEQPGGVKNAPKPGKPRVFVAGIGSGGYGSRRALWRARQAPAPEPDPKVSGAARFARDMSRAIDPRHPPLKVGETMLINPDSASGGKFWGIRAENVPGHTDVRVAVRFGARGTEGQERVIGRYEDQKTADSVMRVKIKAKKARGYEVAKTYPQKIE